MKKRYGLLLVFIPLLVSCKISLNSPQSARDDNYGVGYSDANSAEKNQSEVSTLTEKGEGDCVLTGLSFKKGPLVLHIVSQGNSGIAVSLLTNDGDLIATETKQTPMYEGDLLFNIPKDADHYVIKVETQGSWKLISK